MSKRFPVLLASAVLALALPFIGCGSGGGESAVAATGVAVNPSTLVLQIDKTRQLSASVQPNNATNKGVAWSSSDTGVADVSSSGLVTAKAVGEARITATTQDGGKTASCDVSVTLYDPVEEAKRQAEFERLSVWPPNVQRDIHEVKEMADFNNVPSSFGFWYVPALHRVDGFDYAVSPAVTDPQLKEQLQKEVERQNLAVSHTWEHEYQHARNAKYTRNIRWQNTPRSQWKSGFLDETSAFLSSMMLFRKNMLDEYAKQLEQFVVAGGNPQQFKFSAVSYGEAIGYVLIIEKMAIWYDTNNNFAELMSGVSQDEAAMLMHSYFDFFFHYNFAAYYDISRMDEIYLIFNNPPNIQTSFDTDEFFQKTLNAIFTYKIDDKDVNLFEIMGQIAREEFLAKLNAKMEEEYARWLAGQ
ncbi:MAG: Ig-like domain-containing protein [Holophagales bacterium]|jgi:hypothetical protein|nr:Ig-like domain-containing protein [Holophagales bacterium]